MSKRENASSERRVDVLVTDAWGRSAYNVVRSLARRGLDVIVGTDRFLGMAALSRYAGARVSHPSSTHQTQAFVHRVRDLLQSRKPRVYLPTSEETFIVSRYADVLKTAGVTMPVAPFETLKRLHKKDEIMRLARALNIPTPQTIVPRDAEDVRRFCSAVGSPMVLKRISSSGARGVFYLSAEDLAGPWNGDPPTDAATLNDFVVQEYVRGTGYGVSMLFNHGKLRAKFTHRRLKEKTTTGGISTVRIGVVNPVLEAYAETLLASVNFHGVAMVEFKHDEETGRSWLLEVNPRFWGSLALAIQSGVDFPYLLYRMATEGDIPPVLEYEPGRVVKWILGDLAAIVDRVKHPASWRWPVGSRPDGYDDFYWDDPLPFVGGAVLSLWKVLGNRSRPSHDADLSIELLAPYKPPR